MTADLQTGAEYADAIRRAAVERGVPLSTFLTPITASPRKFMTQLTEAKTPRPLTCNRIRALIDDSAMPRPRGIRITDEPHRQRVESEPVALTAVRVDRDPCPRCAVRGDIGCRHRPWAMRAPVSTPYDQAKEARP